MLNDTFVMDSFIDGLLYKPSDIKALVESEMDETLRFLKIKIIVEKLQLTTFELFEETVDNLNAYKAKVESIVKNENQKKSLLTEISNLILGVIKFVAPWIVKLFGWLTGLVVNTKTFGKSAMAVQSAVKAVTPDAVKKGLSFAMSTYKNADTAFQSLSNTVSQKVNAVFKGTDEKPPVINAEAISQAHSNLVAKIEKWPLIGKVVGWGKKLGISPQGFYTFLAITILSVLAMFGSMGCAIILVLYGANSAAQRLVAAGKEAGQKVADKASQGIEKAGGAPSEAPSDSSNDAAFDSLFSKLGGDKKPEADDEKLSPELETASDKWSSKLKEYADKGDKDTAITKIKGALTQLVKNNDITKEEIPPFIKVVIKKAGSNDDIKKALLGALSDIAVINF